MSKRLLDYDPLTRISTYHWYDSETDTTTIGYEQDMEPFLEKNKAIQGIDGYSKDGIKRNWWCVASIPPGLILKWLYEEGIDVFNKDHWPAVKRKLNDPSYRLIRTGTGTV